MGVRSALRRLWAATMRGRARGRNSVDPETGQTDYGLFVGREERARLERMDAENPPPLSGPITGDLHNDFGRANPAPPPMMPPW